MPDIAIQLGPLYEQLVTRHPNCFEQLRDSRRLDSSSPPKAATLQNLTDSAGLDAGLRQFRNCEMMRIIWRDLNNQSNEEETLIDLSQLADICLQAAVGAHTQSLQNAHGVPSNDQDLI